MEDWVIIAIIASAAAVLIIIIACCCYRSRKKKKQKKKKKQEKAKTKMKEEEKSLEKARAKQGDVPPSPKGRTNDAFQESKGSDTDNSNGKEKAANGDLTVEPPDDNKSLERLDISYNPQVDEQVEVKKVDEQVEVKKVDEKKAVEKRESAKMNNDELKTMQERQEIDLGDPTPPFIRHTSMSSVSERATDSPRPLQDDHQIEGQRQSVPTSNYPKRNPYVSPYSPEVREELGSVVRINSYRRSYEYDQRISAQIHTEPMLHPMSETPIAKLPRPSSFRQDQRNLESPPAVQYHPPRHSYSFRIETEIPSDVRVAAQHKKGNVSKLPSIPPPDYLLSKQRPKQPPKVAPKPWIKKREFKGPYGPEDLDEYNNPYTLGKEAAKKYHITEIE